jgi:hypothetical protein
VADSSCYFETDKRNKESGVGSVTFTTRTKYSRLAVAIRIKCKSKKEKEIFTKLKTFGKEF